MDWTKQSEEMFKNWRETQQKMWDSWLGAVQQGPSKAQAAETWQKAMETWEETVKNALAAQTEWTKQWAESVDGQDLPPEVANWLKQSQEMSEKFGTAQQQLWQGWFDLVKQADLTKLTGNWEEEGQNAFQQWQESAQKVMEAQQQWINMWLPTQNQKADK